MTASLITSFRSSYTASTQSVQSTADHINCTDEHKTHNMCLLPDENICPAIAPQQIVTNFEIVFTFLNRFFRCSLFKSNLGLCLSLQQMKT